MNDRNQAPNSAAAASPHTKGVTAADGYLFLFLLSGLLLSISGHGTFVDENLIIQNVASIVERGELTVRDMFQALEGPDGRYYNRYGIGFPLLMIPFYSVGKLLPNAPWFMGDVRMFCMLLSSSLITALAGWAFYRVCCLLGASRRVGVAFSLILIFATPFWPYSQTLFRNTTSTLVLLLLLWCILLYQTRPQRRYLAFAALLVAFAANLREDLAFGVLLLGGFAVYRLPQSRWRMLGAFALGGLLGTALWGWHNSVRFDRFFVENYQDMAFNYPLIISVPQLLIGKRAGLLLYAPIATLFLLSLPSVRRARQFDLWVLTALLLGSYLMVYGKSNMWYGGVCYGPRYMYFLIPFAMLPGVYWLSRLAWWKPPFLALCFIIGIIFNWPGIYAHQGRHPSFFRSPSFFELLNRPLQHPIYNHETDIDLWWIRMIKLHPDSLAWPLLLLLVCGLFAFFGYRLWASVNKEQKHIEGESM